MIGMYFVPEGQHDRSQARSAWDSAPQKSRPVGYGMIRRGVRAIRRLEKEISNAVSLSRTGMIPGISCARSYRTLRDGSFEGRFPRHFVPGYDHAVPPGQKPFRPSKGLALSSRLWALAWVKFLSGTALKLKGRRQSCRAIL